MRDKDNGSWTFPVVLLFILSILNIWVAGSAFSEARHRIERLEKLQGLPQDTTFFTWPWDEDESRIELDIPRQQETE